MTTASLPLATLYQRGARVDQNRASVRAADADIRATSQMTALEASRAYYRAALAQVSAEVADNVTLWLDSVVAYNRTRVAQGAAAESDLIRSELERDRAFADAGVQAAELARARADLSRFIGAGFSANETWSVRLDDAPLLLPGIEKSEIRSVEVAASGRSPSQTQPVLGPTGIERRSDVVAARERLVAATAGTSLEQRMLVRELGAMFGVKQSGGMNSMLLGLSIPLPVFDQNRGGLASARALRDVAAFELRAQEQSAGAELLGAQEAARVLTQRTLSLARRDSSGRGALYLKRADEARAITLGAYREGAVSLLQVLDAARAWGEAQVAFYRTLYAQHDAVLSLLVAQGDDLIALFPTVTPVSR